MLNVWRVFRVKSPVFETFYRKIAMMKLFDVFGEFFYKLNTYFVIRKFGRSVGRGFLRSVGSLFSWFSLFSFLNPNPKIKCSKLHLISQWP